MVTDIHSVCKITASQRTFSGQKCCLSGHTDICMDKMSGQSFNKDSVSTHFSKVILHTVHLNLLSLLIHYLVRVRLMTSFIKTLNRLTHSPLGS